MYHWTVESRNLGLKVVFLFRSFLVLNVGSPEITLEFPLKQKIEIIIFKKLLEAASPQICATGEMHKVCKILTTN